MLFHKNPLTQEWLPDNIDLWNRISDTEWVDKNSEWVVRCEDEQCLFVEVATNKLHLLHTSQPGLLLPVEDNAQKLQHDEQEGGQPKYIEESESPDQTFDEGFGEKEQEEDERQTDQHETKRRKMESDIDSDSSVSEESDDDLHLDFAEDIAVSYFSAHDVGEEGSKTWCMKKELLPLETFAKDGAKSESCTVMNALFAGCDGAYSAEYCRNNYGRNVLSSFRNLRQSGKPTRKGNDTHQLMKWDALIDDAPFRVSAIAKSLKLGVEQTDRNLLDLARRHDKQDSSSLAGLVLDGPDQEGQLWLHTVSVGDCEIYLFNTDGTFTNLSGNHTAGNASEKSLIISREGKIEDGVVISNNGEKGTNLSRCMGGYRLKYASSKTRKQTNWMKSELMKNAAVTCAPFICSDLVDFEKNVHVIIATKSLFQKLTPTQLFKALKAGSTEEFVEFLQESQLEWKANTETEKAGADEEIREQKSRGTDEGTKNASRNPEDLRTWLDERAKNWIRNHSFNKVSSFVFCHHEKAIMNTRLCQNL